MADAMTADVLAGLRAECARRLCGAPPNTQCFCERDGNASPCPVWLAAADRVLTRVLAFAAEQACVRAECYDDAIALEAFFRALADAAERAPGGA